VTNYSHGHRSAQYSYNATSPNYALGSGEGYYNEVTVILSSLGHSSLSRLFMEL
jgi:hypothetical protein